MAALYDTIGVDYANLRKADSRIAAQLHGALGGARRIVNVGAGAGSYEPADRLVTAVEPSAAMIAQRPEGAGHAVRASAERLPFADASFEAAMAVLTVHHWSDQDRGLRELRRVSRGPVVILTFDPAWRRAWLNDYFPELAALDDVQMPAIQAYEEALGPVRITPVLVPHDCTDGFLYAYWRRPGAYLDARIRAGSSSFWKIDGVQAGLDRLAADLADGTWARRYGALLTHDAYDAGYRLIQTL
jgi:SAM-dependent methyltransferase